MSRSRCAVQACDLCSAIRVESCRSGSAPTAEPIRLSRNWGGVDVAAISGVDSALSPPTARHHERRIRVAIAEEQTRWCQGYCEADG